MTTPLRTWLVDLLFVFVLLLALLPRLQLAQTREYIHDEENTAIPLSKTISFEPGSLNLPLRGENHGAMPAYFVKASSVWFGTSPFGHRAVHLFFGLVAVVLIYLLARQWYGPVAAIWAASLFAFNEYYLGISSRATAHVPHLLFVSGAVFAFSRFLRTERPGYLYAAGASLGLAFYCKEHSALLLLVFFAVLLRAKYRDWLRTPHPYLACLLFALILSPDLVWNARTDPQTARVTYSGQALGQATYWAHLQRVGGLGLSPYPAMFYAKAPVMSIYEAVTKMELRDETREYQSMNAVLGILLVTAVIATTFGAVPRDDLRAFLLTMAWGIFMFFTLIKRGNPPYRLDPVSWIWVEVTIIPAVILAGARLADVRSRWRMALWVLTAAVLAYSVYAVLSFEG